MFFEEFLDLLAVVVQLLLEGAQEFAQAHGQLAFGADDGGAGFEVSGLGEEGQAFFGGLGAPEFVLVQEFLPEARAGFEQSLGSGKLENKFPGEGMSPVIESFDGGGIIFDKRLLELVDQGGALFDERHFITAE